MITIRHPILIILLVITLLIASILGILYLVNFVKNTKDIIIRGSVINSAVGWSVTVDDVTTQPNYMPFSFFDWFVDPYIPFLQTDNIIVKANLYKNNEIVHSGVVDLGHKITLYSSSGYTVTIKTVEPGSYVLKVFVYEGKTLQTFKNYGEVDIS